MEVEMGWHGLTLFFEHGMCKPFKDRKRIVFEAISALLYFFFFTIFFRIAGVTGISSSYYRGVVSELPSLRVTFRYIPILGTLHQLHEGLWRSGRVRLNY